MPPARLLLLAIVHAGVAACAPPRVTPADPAPTSEAEPEPEMRPHPEVPPDELAEQDASVGVPVASTGDRDAAVATCNELPPPPPLTRTAPRISAGPPVTNHIPPELVMRPIRGRASCVRRCYEDGMTRNPRLAGRVAVRFVIDLDGWVRTARPDQNETGDEAFAACVARQFVGLAYPEPDGARITVVYPVVFAPES